MYFCLVSHATATKKGEVRNANMHNGNQLRESTGYLYELYSRHCAFFHFFLFSLNTFSFLNPNSAHVSKTQHLFASSSFEFRAEASNLWSTRTLEPGLYACASPGTLHVEDRVK